MSVESAQILHDLAAGALLDAQQLGELVRACYWGKFASKDVILTTLRDRNWLTDYQINEIARGRGAELRLKRYVILEKLGEGGFGRVFRARDTGFIQRDVTLKILRPEMAENPVAARRFQREIMFLGNLDCRHLIRAVDADRDKDVWFVVLDYVRGSDIKKLVTRRGRLPWREACDIARQAAEGLRYLAGKHLVHRDIKPSNLLVEEVTGRVLILDLGLARAEELFPGFSLLSVATTTGMMIGTPEFMAPEQFDDPKAVDIRSDLYSLGCSLYYMLTGQPPFQGQSLPQVMHAVLHGKPPALAVVCPDVPPLVAGAVERLMAKRLVDRPSHPDELVAILTVALEDDQPTAPSSLDFIT